MVKKAVFPVVSEKALTKAARNMEEWQKRREEYTKHEVYYIEDSQNITFIPGGTTPLRRKLVYDKTSGKLLAILPLGENVKLIDDLEVEKELLNAIIQHPIRAFNKGIFLRKLCFDGRADCLCDLLEVMHGHNIPRSVIPNRTKKENKGDYESRKQQYLNMLFGLVISYG